MTSAIFTLFYHRDVIHESSENPLFPMGNNGKFRGTFYHGFPMGNNEKHKTNRYIGYFFNGDVGSMVV